MASSSTAPVGPRPQRNTESPPRAVRPRGPASAAWLIITILASVSCGSDSLAGVVDVVTTWRDVDVLGSDRRYRLHVPDGAGGAGGSPLLLVFHGATQGAAGIELMSWLYPAAESAGMILAFPDAAGDYWNTPNSPPGFWDIPDVQFIDAVIDDVDALHTVDRDRIYATGFSNGAIFAEVLACLRGNTIASVAVVGAGMSAEISQSCPWERPMPTIVFFGDADPQFFWDDGFASGVGMLGGAGTGAWLASTNHCAPDPTVIDVSGEVEGEDETSVQLWRYEGCANQADVDMYRIVGGGHTWPGSPLNVTANLGRKTRRINASRTMVDFFLAHTLQGVGP